MLVRTSSNSWSETHHSTPSDEINRLSRIFPNIEEITMLIHVRDDILQVLNEFSRLRIASFFWPPSSSKKTTKSPKIKRIPSQKMLYQFGFSVNEWWNWNKKKEQSKMNWIVLIHWIQRRFYYTNFYWLYCINAYSTLMFIHSRLFRMWDVSFSTNSPRWLVAFTRRSSDWEAMPSLSFGKIKSL